MVVTITSSSSSLFCAITIMSFCKLAHCCGVMSCMQTLELSSSSLFCADAGERGREWAAGAAADVPGAHLLRAGYHLIAAEPLLRVALRPPTSEDGAHVQHLP